MSPVARAHRRSTLATDDAAGYLEVFRRTIERYGRPLAVYSDHHAIFIKDPNRPPTLAEQLAGKRSFTQVGRALDEAAIGWIGASSPQAKGRVERLWGTKQDRLVSELRRARASTIEEANVVLARYLPRHNRRFALEAADPEPAWRAWPAELDLAAVFGFCYSRRVANDATLAWAGTSLALPRRADGRSWAGRTVTLEERLDGSLSVGAEGIHQRLTEAPPVAPVCGPASSSGSRPGTARRRRPRSASPRSPRPDPGHRPRHRSIPGDAALWSDHGDKVAGRFTVRIAVPRHRIRRSLSAMGGSRWQRTSEAQPGRRELGVPFMACSPLRRPSAVLGRQDQTGRQPVRVVADDRLAMLQVVADPLVHEHVAAEATLLDGQDVAAPGQVPAARSRLSV